MKKYLFVISIIAPLFIVFSVQAKRKNFESNFTPTNYSSQNQEDNQTETTNTGTSLANLQNQVNLLQSKLQTLTGDIGRNYKENKDQDKIIMDAHNRMQTLEDKITNLSTQLRELQIEGLLKPVASKRMNEYLDYAKGLDYVNAGSYSKAIDAMIKFKSKNPKSVYNSYAQFWIGESYYQQGDYQMAIKELQKLFDINKKSSKAPLAKYRQGLAFSQLKAYDDAKAFFNNLIKTYPTSIEAIQAKAQIARIETIQELNRQRSLELNLVK